MGSRVNVCSINFLNNPAKFTDQFQLEITFEVFETLPGDLEWKLVYVGSGESNQYDQELDSALVGPTPEGKHKFVLTTPAPDASKIPDQDVAGVSVLLLKLKYNDNEFQNLGWWVSNEYTDEELKENPPATPVVDKLLRTVKVDDIRITSYPIRWTESQEEVQMPPQEEEMLDEADLMPLHDDSKEEIEEAYEDEEVDDEEAQDDEGEADIDLEATASKDEEESEDDEEGDSLADDVETTPTEQTDEVMDDSTENGASNHETNNKNVAAVTEEHPKEDAILGDMTNE